MNSLSESKSGSRGPLIAVIKIELDADNVDRIFLHQKDNDQILTEQFVAKHYLNPALKRHIFQRIQMSRMAVDRQIMNLSSDNNTQQTPTKSNFHSPLQRNEHSFQESETKQINPYNRQKNSIQQQTNKYNRHSDKQSDKQSAKMTQNREAKYGKKNDIKMAASKSQNQQQDRNKYHNYITYSDSENDQNNAIQGVKYYAHNKSNHTNDIKMKGSQELNFNQSFDAIQKSSQQIAQVSYRPNRFQKMYDISGLKLKSNYPSNKVNENMRQAQIKPKKYGNLQQQSSQSSQGLFQRQISDKKPSQQNQESLAHQDYFNKFDKINLQKDIAYEADKINHAKKQKIQQFEEVPQDFSRPAGQFTRHRIDRLQIDIQDQKNLQKPINQINHQKLRIGPGIKNMPYGKQAPFDANDVNYISFNKPNYDIFSPIGHKNQKNYKQNVAENQLCKDLTENNEEQSFKRVGSIRSNHKMSVDQTYGQKKTGNPTGKLPLNHNMRHNSSNQTLEIHSELQTTTKFNQQKLFQDIKEIRHRMQQNRQMNEQQTNRPSRVKFYNKEELKSLKQSSHGSKSKAQISRTTTQVTNRLYNEADIKKKYLNALKSRAKNLKEQEECENQQLTYRPQINILSKAIAEKRIKNNLKLQDHLIEQGRMIELKKQQMINHQARKHLEQCSFRPQINQQTYRINALQRSRSKSHIDSHSEVKSSKITYIQATFHPQINKLSNQLAKSKGNFEQRQQTYMEQKNSKMFKKLQQQILKDKIDLKSGQQLFQPKITEKSQKIVKQSLQKDRSTKNIHQHLFNLSKITQYQEKVDRKPIISTESERILYELHQKRLNWLFMELDNDEDGVISSSKICIDQIPTQILEIVAPVLYQMEHMETKLSLQGFKNAIKNLNRSLDPYEKSILYNYNYSAKPIRH